MCSLRPAEAVTARAFFDRLDDARARDRAARAARDVTDCCECAGHGSDPDGVPCEYCDGTGVWTEVG